eukprot:Blabericola_migrator_1__6674@NODE_3370_length_1826_cov_543_490620_g2101_i0_p2_GENE_NODE_3370_length_1826_cov_543_490620_g2101_i0NODE_3370_length_1826_cov_543_490620_g2101_i0_p2_ORF_typecomplete_len195_score23_05DUF4131/PF13567_6/0_02_NODE_3370_length_1826_cov_543_490620_g2101_i0238822
MLSLRALVPTNATSYDLYTEPDEDPKIWEGWEKWRRHQVLFSFVCLLVLFFLCCGLGTLLLRRLAPPPALPRQETGEPLAVVVGEVQPVSSVSRPPPQIVVAAPVAPPPLQSPEIPASPLNAQLYQYPYTGQAGPTNQSGSALPAGQAPRARLVQLGELSQTDQLIQGEEMRHADRTSTLPENRDARIQTQHTL